MRDHGRGFVKKTPRDYQLQCIESTVDLWQTHRTLLGSAATGLGKTIVMAMLAEHSVNVRRRRVMVLADTKQLVEQLAQAIASATGLPVDIEMGDQYADQKSILASKAPIIVSSVQTQYSGNPGFERMRRFRPSEFDLFLDETEFFMAPSYRKVVDYYLQDDGCRMLGVTATPMRTDGKSLGQMFEAVAFEYDLRYGIENGWLVPPRQAFVRTSVDFSTVRTDRKTGDYKDSDLRQLIEMEEEQYRIARGIVKSCGDRRSIIVSGKTETASMIADYLNAERPHSARCLFGTMDTRVRRETLQSHQADLYQYLSSVNMLTKGYDDPGIRAVAICRPTKSRRLYIQTLGRGTRPLPGVVDGIEDPSDRIAAIAESDKPDVIIADLIGVDGSVRNMSVTDILAGDMDPIVVEKAKKIVEESDGHVSSDEAIEQAQAEHEENERRLAQARASVQADVSVSVTEGDVFDMFGPAVGSLVKSKGAKISTVKLLRDAKVPEKDICTLVRNGSEGRVAQEITRRRKAGKATYKQSKLLNRWGLPHDVPFKTANDWIDRWINSKDHDGVRAEAARFGGGG